MTQGNSMNILIVDDESGYREPLTAMLGCEGYRVCAAASGREAIEASSHFPPDLIIVDWMLRDQTDGLAVIQTLRSSFPSLKTIVITGYPTATLETRIANVPGCQLLAKPFTWKELTTAISTLVGETPDNSNGKQSAQ
jgi:DNA-binding response OmpR family regulator